MVSGRSLRSWFVLGLLGIAPGCAQSGPLVSQRTSVGSLKTSLSRVEYENEQLRREVASLRSENRQIEDRLVQEETANGELTARLDDARDLLRRRGLGAGDGSEMSRIDAGPSVPRNTLPAGRSNRKTRRPPFARIPGRIDTVPSAEDPGDFNPGSGRDTPGDPSGDDPGPQSRLDRPTVWLPVARGTSDPGTPRR